MAKQQIRIIGGQWRGRKLPVLEQQGLRPTPDRVRETLFNWLAPSIVGAKCLDCFAGTGALGFEALSRGAASVVMVEKHRETAQRLIANTELLQTQAADIFQEDFFAVLPNFKQQFDLIFIDPPFGQTLVAPTLEALHTARCTSAAALIYVEAEKPLEQLTSSTEPWKIIKQKRAGQVHYHLLAELDIT